MFLCSSFSVGNHSPGLLSSMPMISFSSVSIFKAADKKSCVVSSVSRHPQAQFLFFFSINGLQILFLCMSHNLFFLETRLTDNFDSSHSPEFVVSACCGL